MNRNRIVMAACVVSGILLLAIIAVSAVVANKPEMATGAFWREWSHNRKVTALKKNHASEVLPLYNKIEVGMSRSEVERLLGKPIIPEPEGNPDVWYLKPSPHFYAESPRAFGSICVKYDSGKVKEKKLIL